MLPPSRPLLAPLSFLVTLGHSSIISLLLLLHPNTTQNSIKKPLKKTALEKLMVKWRLGQQQGEARRRALLEAQALVDQAAAALTAEGLTDSVNADKKAMLAVAVSDPSFTTGTGITQKRVRNTDSGIGSSVDSV
ncbi:uncharacterized protein B0T23DRAFT_396436 [Neurospora hispaniola]|uniref:Uncharacterized protein n=1 Tax=Neurospora hispaniola TaxID=588809 RepID=A0AAJ0MPX1_9PEZI|nr:hypothetical protein B0T23DRAFT_396436 [Neurospora hispaniola]